MTSTTFGVTAAHRKCYSLLERLTKTDHLRYQYALNSSFARRSMRSVLTTTTSATAISWRSRPLALAGGFSSNRTTTPCNSSAIFCNPIKSDMIIRSFGRKGSQMGHHLQNLDEMAHTQSHEEAKHRREEKKKKSKTARLASHKEGNNSPAESTNADDTSDDGMDGSSEDDTIDPNVDELGMPLLPESKTIRSKMLLVVANLERSFASIRGGEATPELFDGIRVSVYGETVPLSSVGQVVIEDPQRATISCYDPSVASDVRDAVRDMPGMNLSPYIEEGGSGVIIVPIPRVNEETRKEIVKELGRQAENGRQRVRKIRRGAMDVIKKGKDGKLEGISKDDAFRVGKEVDTVTEEVLSVLNEIVARKQKSVMDD